MLEVEKAICHLETKAGNTKMWKQLFYLYLSLMRARMGYFVHHSIAIQWEKKGKETDNLIPHLIPNEIWPIAFIES